MNTNPSRYKKIIRYVLAIACVVYIFRFFANNTDDLKLLLDLDPLAILAMAFFAVLGHVIFSWRFQIVLEKCSGKSVSFGHWFKIVILGRFLSLLAPQAGNIYRSIALKKNYQISYTRYASSFFSFIWMDASVNLLLAATIIAIVQPGLRIGRLPAMPLLAGLIVIVFATPLLMELVFRVPLFRNTKLAWIHTKLAEMLRVSVSNLRDPIFMSKILLTGMIAFADTIAIFFVCFRALDIAIDLPTLALFFVVLRLSTLIMITPGNIGVRELAYGIISQQMQFGMAQGILVSIIIRIIGTIVILAFGSFFGGIGLLHSSDHCVIPEESEEDIVSKKT